MELKVKLHGTLGSGENIEVEIPEGGKVKDLLSALPIPGGMKAVVVVEGRVLKPEDELSPKALVYIFQPFHGG